LPLDRYVLDAYDLQTAGNIATSDCMQAMGIAWPVAPPFEGQEAPITSRAGRRLFDVALAQRYGYRSGPLQPMPVGGVPNDRKLTATEEVAFHRCANVAPKLFGFDPDSINFAQGLTFAADEEVVRDPELGRRVQAWKQCMRPLGLADYPRDPRIVMPTPSQRKRWGGYPADGEPTTVFVGSPDEIRQATFDAKCRESSGYAQFVYQAEVDAQLRLIDKYRTKLSQALVALRRANERMNAAIRKRFG
jgi:hypothetical protein